MGSSVAGKFSGLPRPLPDCESTELCPGPAGLSTAVLRAMTGEGVEEDAEGVASGDGVPQFWGGSKDTLSGVV